MSVADGIDARQVVKLSVLRLVVVYRRIGIRACREYGKSRGGGEKRNGFRYAVTVRKEIMLADVKGIVGSRLVGRGLEAHAGERLYSRKEYPSVKRGGGARFSDSLESGADKTVIGRCHKASVKLVILTVLAERALDDSLLSLGIRA